MDLRILRSIGFILGIFLMTLAVAMTIPTFTLLAFKHSGNDMSAFVWSALITAGFGYVFMVPGRPRHTHMRPRDIYLLTTTSWLVVCVFAALPMMLIRSITYTDAFFETMGGITTTRATILTGLEKTSKAPLMWRSLLQWLGGIGFIGMAVAILPMLSIGGMRLFQTESSDRSDKVMPRSHIVAKYIVITYILFTLFGIIAYRLSGMDLFDAVNMAMTSIATGGYSTSDQSLGHFSPAAHWVAVILMLLGSLPSVLYVAGAKGDPQRLLKDQQVRGFFTVVLLACTILSLWLYLTSEYSLLDCIRLGTVTSVSVISSTNFVVEDYSQWGSFAIMCFFYMVFIGGCSGSTTGGVKIFRYQIAFTLLRGSLRQMAHPRTVICQKYNGYPLDEEVVRSILAFTFFFAFSIGFITLLLCLLGLDPVTAFTGAMSALCNTGTGLGEVIGPDGSFASLPDVAKWILAFGMLLGRLEIITILVLFTPAFWRY